MGTILNHYELFTGIVHESGMQRFLFFSFPSLVKNLYTQIISVNPFLFLGFAFSFYLIIKNRAKEFYPIIAVILIQFIFYLGKSWSGEMFVGSVGTSYARYLLPSICLMGIMTVYSIDNILKKKILITKVFLFFLPLYIVFNFNKAMNSEMAYHYFLHTTNWSTKVKSNFCKISSPDSIFFFKMGDKYVFPARMTAIYSVIPQEKRLEKVAKLSQELLDDGIDVYFVGEKKFSENDYSEEEYLKNFKDNGFVINKVLAKELNDYDVYEITR